MTSVNPYGIILIDKKVALWLTKIGEKMKAPERRKAIAELLHSLKEAISGSALSARFGVSRQIIVQDIATLKSEGYDILSTHYGYVLKASPLLSRTFKVYHSEEETEDELSSIVAQGATVADVFVRHNVYGKLEAALNIFTIPQVKLFVASVKDGNSAGLMSITGGYHYHTVRAATEEILDRVEKVLADKGYLIKED